MTQGIAVTAYKDFPTLRNLVTKLTSFGFFVAVHVDRKAPFSPAEMDEIRSLGALVISKYRVGWGSYNHLLAIIDLLEVILAQDGIEYVHTVSGQDLVVASKDQFLEVCDGRVFLKAIPHEGLSQHIRDRYEIRDWLSPIETVWGFRKIRFLTRKLHALLGLPRNKYIGPYRDIFKGLVWATMPAHVCADILSEAKRNGFLRALRGVDVPEEFFFQTLIMNSSHSHLLAESNLRFTDWKDDGKGWAAAYLDASYAPEISASGALFARKVDSRRSQELLQIYSSPQLPGRLSTPQEG